MFNFPKELVIALIIVLVLFGPKRLPELGKALGKTMRNLRGGIEGKSDDEGLTSASVEEDASNTAAGTVPTASRKAEVSN